MATYSSILAWKNPWSEEPGRLQSTVSLRVGLSYQTTTMNKLVNVSICFPDFSKPLANQSKPRREVFATSYLTLVGQKHRYNNCWLVRSTCNNNNPDLQLTRAVSWDQAFNFWDLTLSPGGKY